MSLERTTAKVFTIMPDTTEVAQVNIGKALEFIKRYVANWRQEWLVQLCTFEPVNDSMAVPVAQVDCLASFIDKYQSQNLYIAVNPLWHDPGKKCSREDIAALAYVHADLDPPKVKLSAEQLAVNKQRLQAAAEALAVPPGTMIDTGNGVAAYWQLDTPVRVDSVDRRISADSLGDTNRRLAQDLGGDSGATDISRVMRLPFTTNYPTRTKVALERPVSPTRLLYQHEATHSLADFDFLAPIEEKPQAADLTFELALVDQTALVARLAAVQSDTDLKLLLEGKPPIWLNDQTRNGFDFALALTLNRLHFTPDQIAACLANYEYGKTERHVDDKYIGSILRKVCTPLPTADPPAADTATWRSLKLEHGRTTEEDLHKVDEPWPHAIFPLRPMGTLSIFGGANGLGKSTEVLSQELHIASGRDYWGMSVTKGRAIFLSCEDPRQIIKARMQAWLEAIPKDERPSVERDLQKNLFFFGADETGGMQLTIKEFAKCEPSREAIELLVALGQGAVSITVETVAMLNGGDEMNTDFMQLALALKEVALRTGASVQAIHHISKEAVGKTPTVYSLRGASALADALRGATIMHELQPDLMKALAITRIDSMPVMGLYNVKASYAPCHAPVYIRRVPGPRFEAVDASESRAKANERARLLKYLQRPENREGVSLHYLQDNCTQFGIGKREVEMVLHRMEMHETVERIDSTEIGKKGPKHDIWRVIEPTEPYCANTVAQ